MTWWWLSWISLIRHIFADTTSKSRFCLWVIVYLKDRRTSSCCWGFSRWIYWPNVYQNVGLVIGWRSRCMKTCSWKRDGWRRGLRWRYRWWVSGWSVQLTNCWRWICHRWSGGERGFRIWAAISSITQCGSLCSREVGWWVRRPEASACCWSSQTPLFRIIACPLVTEGMFRELLAIGWTRTLMCRRWSIWFTFWLLLLCGYLELGVIGVITDLVSEF